MDELFPILNEDGEVIGSATRALCHNGTMLLHPVVHLHVLDKEGNLLLQKRSFHKDIQPGKWDTSVGGHIDYGESITDALMRETREELGIENFSPIAIQSYIFQSDKERELVNVFYTTLDSDKPDVKYDPIEIDGIGWFNKQDVLELIAAGETTPNFASEFQKIDLAKLMI